MGARFQSPRKRSSQAIRCVLGLLLTVLVAACGDLPRPFAGNPGATAERLAQPPPSRLFVPASSDVLLDDAGSRAFAAALADALADQEVPAFAVIDTRRQGEWRLRTRAERRGGQVVLTYTVENPAGVQQGVTQGPPVDADAWARGTPDTLRQAAAAAAGPTAALLTRIEAARQESDPNSLLNRPPRVVVTGVTGAPGDGNRALAREMLHELPKLGEVVQDTPEGADFAVAGNVTTTKSAPGKLRVEIEWVVSSPGGDQRGKIVQLNEVPAGSLEPYWGDVAAVVAQQAASGVRDVILNQIGKKQGGSGAGGSAS